MEAKKYNKSLILKRAWNMYKAETEKTRSMFSICLKKSWQIAKEVPTFDEIYKKNRNRVIGQIMQTYKNMDVAEEICNTVFLELNEILHLHDTSIRKIESWLHWTTKNRLIDYMRTEGKKAMQTTEISEFADETGKEYFQIADKGTASDSIENNELKTQIFNAFNKLKPNYRKIADMAFIQQLTYEEIADELNMPMNSVKVNILRVRKMLQAELQPVYVSI
jgi:RNA polymerase sigma-70 factor, ECF subfamily